MRGASLHVAAADAGIKRGFSRVFRGNAGPGVSKTREEVTISAINRNFPGRSGPGQLYLANPYTVAASAITGYITTWEPGMVLESARSG